MSQYKYTVNYKGSRVSSNTMLGIAEIIATSEHKSPSKIYKNLTGRSMSAKQLATVKKSMAATKREMVASRKRIAKYNSR